MTVVNILAIDGGALKGVIPARILSYLEGNAANGTYSGVQISNTLSKVPSLGKQCYAAFDYIAGTSTGGLMAAGLSIAPVNGPKTSSALTSNDLLGFYCTNASSIFPATGKDTMFDLLTTTKPLFKNSGLCSAIAELYGAPSWAKDSTGASINNPSGNSANLSQALTNILITSFNNYAPPSNSDNLPWMYEINSSTPGGPLLLTQNSICENSNFTGQQAVSVLQACLMTSACPLLLPPVPFDLQFAPSGADAGTIPYFLDGGVFAGSPALAAYLFAVKQGLTINSFISIGCGSEQAANPLQYSTVANWGGGLGLMDMNKGWLANDFLSPMINLLTSGAGDFVHTMLGQLLPGRFFRLNPTIPESVNYLAYDSTPAALQGWVAAADALVEQLSNSGDWQQMLDVINPSSTPSSGNR